MRSLLFAGALRPDLVDKLPRSRPDAAVIDLEDAVPVEHKERARAACADATRRLAKTFPGQAVYVRVNPVQTAWFAGDVAEAVTTAAAGVVIPKLESPEQVQSVRATLEAAGLSGARLIAGIESARGVLAVDATLAAGVDAAYFGAEDYIADLGGRRTPLGDEVLYARSRVVLAARVAGVAAIDQAVVDIRDDELFRRDAGAGRDLGYGGKICIHPRQVQLANAIFGASLEEVTRARRMLQAAEAAAASGVGAIVFEDAMVDEPTLRMARATLARATATDSTTEEAESDG